MRWSENKGTSSFPLIVLYGVILGILLFALFITVYERQMDIRVQEEATSLVEELGRTAFLALAGGQPFKDLPLDLGGCPYELEIQENSIFVVRITGGRGSGNEYTSVITGNISVENGKFEPGGRVYFMRVEESLLVSSSPISPPSWEIEVSPTQSPPAFYWFCKEKPKEAAGIIASYFTLLEPGYVLTRYSWDGEDNLIVEWKKGTEVRVFLVSGYENNRPVESVENAWIVDCVQSGTCEELSGEENNMDLDNAVATGWLFSPEKVLGDLRKRTWKVGGQLVIIPSDSEISSACVTTNIGKSYPTWRISWENHVVYYRAMPWWEYENEPGFIMQSLPHLEPVL